MAPSRSRTAPADCSGYATRRRPPFWSACDDGAKEISDSRDESRNRTVLGGGQAGQVHDQALHRVRRSTLFPALDLSVLLFRQDGVGAELGRGHDLYFQLDAQIRERPLRDRLRDLERRSLAADQFCRLRSGKIEDRPEGEGGVQADRRRAAAVLHAGVDYPPPLWRRVAAEGSRVRGWIRGAMFSRRR